MVQKRSPYSRNSSQTGRVDTTSPAGYLTKLIERDAPLRSDSLLVLMYGPFQAEMSPETGKGIGSWLKEQVARNGLPSLVRFGSHRRAQVFRLDQLQPMLESLMAKG